MQSLSRDGQPPLPSIDSLWDRIEKWMDEEYPELEDNLNDGVTTADLNEFENDLAIGKLPTEFRQFYKRHDGQLRGGKPTGIIMGLTLLDLESIFEEYSVWSKVAERLERANNTHMPRIPKEGSSKHPGRNTFITNQRSIPPNSIQPYYYYRGWIPILKDHIGNQIALDLAPGPNGNWGQIIIFGRDFDTKLVVASSFQEFIWIFVQDLENGNYSIDSNQFNEDLGFLGNSRNDEYMIGDEDEDQGELSFYDHDGKEFGGSLKGRLSYIEILKRRALKTHGLTESYSTAFTPPKISIKKELAGMPIGKDSSNGLLNVDVALPKETLIDDDSSSKEVATEESSSEKDESKPQPATQASSEEPSKITQESPESDSQPEINDDIKVEPVEEAKSESQESKKEASEATEETNETEEQAKEAEETIQTEEKTTETDEATKPEEIDDETNSVTKKVDDITLDESEDHDNLKEVEL
jgi:cell wall assembly regulator SMI1